jgi:two-component system KDP operon response regulator KdpE
MLDITLSPAGFRVTAPDAIEEPVELVAKHQPDVMVMSFEDPKDLSMLAEIKQRFGLPVMVTTLLSDQQVRVYALEAGADDFLLKSADIDVAERVSFILGTPTERAGAVQVLTLGRDRIEIDHRQRLVKRNGRNLKLNRSEWALLAELTERPGEPYFDGELLVKAFGREYQDESAYFRLWVDACKGS